MLVRWIVVMLLTTSRFSGAEQVAAASGASILVVYDTRTGNTEQLAGAVLEGVSSVANVEALSKPQSDVEDREILEAAGIILGSPVHWGSLSAKSKSFLDRVADLLVAEKQIGRDATSRVRTGGAFVTGGAVASGKELARIAILTAFINMRFVVIGAVDAEGFGTLGAQATTGPTDPGLSEDELEEARAFGRRFAEITLRLTQ